MELYTISIEEIAKIPLAYGERHFPRRMERAGKFRRREDFLRCVGAGFLLESAGIHEADIRFNEYGKPFVKTDGLFFSLSHSGAYALLAVDSESVGCDIEKNEKPHEGVARRVFTPSELKWMSLSPERRFYELWTLKESAAKLDGRGLQIELLSFSVLPMTQGKPILTENGPVYGRSTKYYDCTVSVCSKKYIDNMVLRSVQW